MGKTVTIEIHGVDKIIKDLGKIANTDNVRSAITKATAIVETTAKTTCPVDSGNLRNSISMKVENGDEIVGKVYTTCEYAPYVEFGTGVRGQGSAYPNAGELGISYSGSWAGHVAQPFLYPALKQNKAKINKLIESAIKNSI